MEVCAMHDFVQEFGLFLWAVLAHWQSYVTGGIVTAGVGIYERRTGRTIPWRLYVSLFFVSAGLVAFFYAWHDEHINTQTVISEKAQAVGERGVCQADVKSFAAQNVLLQSQVASQQTTINNQQTNLAAMQQGVNSQQSTINNCVVSLSKANAPSPLHLTNLMDVYKPPDPKWKHHVLMTIMTNQTVTGRFRLTCDGSIAEVRALIAGRGSFLDSTRKVLSNSFLITNAAMLTPTSPMIAVISYDEDDLGTCSVIGD
jgi:hypothetical protein